MNEEQLLSQPTDEEQEGYQSVKDNGYTEVEIKGTGKKYKIRWLKYHQQEKISRLLLKESRVADDDGNEDVAESVISSAKLACKVAAVYTLNEWYMLRLLYWFRWRWFYYVKEYSCEQLKDILEEGKKKVPQMQYYVATTLLIGAKNTLMTMREKEVERFLQERDTERHSR